MVENLRAEAKLRRNNILPFSLFDHLSSTPTNIEINSISYYEKVKSRHSSCDRTVPAAFCMPSAARRAELSFLFERPCELVIRLTLTTELAFRFALPANFFRHSAGLRVNKLTSVASCIFSPRKPRSARNCSCIYFFLYSVEVLFINIQIDGSFTDLRRYHTNDRQCSRTLLNNSKSIIVSAIA